VRGPGHSLPGKFLEIEALGNGISGIISEEKSAHCNVSYRISQKAKGSFRGGTVEGGPL